MLTRSKKRKLDALENLFNYDEALRIISNYESGCFQSPEIRNLIFDTGRLHLSMRIEVDPDCYMFRSFCYEDNDPKDDLIIITNVVNCCKRVQLDIEISKRLMIKDIMLRFNTIPDEIEKEIWGYMTPPVEFYRNVNN